VKGRSGWEIGFGLAALLAGLALGGVALVTSVGGDEPRQSLASGLGATSSLSPVVVRFGDPAAARVDLVVDRSRVAVGSVRVRARFAPLGATARPVARRDAGDLTRIRYEFTLRCLVNRCLPGKYGEKREFELPPVRVTYRTRLGGFDRTRELRWPLFAVVSRISARELARARRANPLRIDDLSTSGLTLGHIAGSWKESAATPPSPSYRVSPTLLTGGLFGLAALLAVAACALVATQVRLRPAARRLSQPVGSPLTQALGVLDFALRNGHVSERRRALELVARVLREHGEADLADRARRLAWAEATSKDDAQSLATDLRDVQRSEDGDAA
jgi:hypothetical protein